jgi:O-antigen/teichoic acid export membrane protein
VRSLTTAPRRIVKESLQRLDQDSLWLLAQSIYTMLLGLCVTGAAARIYGPSSFGVLAIAIAISVLATPIATLGLDGVVVHALVKRAAPDSVVLRTTIALRLASSTGLVAAVSSAAFAVQGGNHDPLIVACLALSLVLKTGESYLPWFQARSHIRRSSIARMCAYTATTVVRAVVLLAGLPLTAYALTYAVDAALVWSALLLAKRSASGTTTDARHFSPELAKQLLARAWPLMLSGLAVALYNRIDQVMLGYMLSEKADVGRYAASVTLAESWYFIPLAVVVARQARVMRAHEESESGFVIEAQRLFDHSIWLSAGCAALAAVGSPILLTLLFGSAFVTREAVICAGLLSLAGILAITGSARAPWLIAKGLERYTVLYLTSGAVVNVVLNLALIPPFGIVGSAAATLTAQVTAVVLLPLAIAATRPSVVHMAQAVDVRRLGRERAQTERQDGGI